MSGSDTFFQMRERSHLSARSANERALCFYVRPGSEVCETTATHNQMRHD